ncbi:integral membrane protein-like protein [Amniculicola lignicola CBS 123094]|uniref:Integral membrane protein-like protein n=1 Tax=Amniculicola lignicola CBS 123094 TaxID=1392246 RepID=A0A6A5WJZ0_9PLEO|nr:integral membrane protein-like protein [Amniculicola lignicola CBS 123094]
MRPTALIPALICAAALILSFLCLFAGHKKNFLENYHMLTLNTSRIGYNLVDSDDATNTSNPVTNLWNEFTNNIGDEVNEFAGDLAERLGVEDFYSAHLLDYCYGSYVPGVMPNATVKSSQIHKSVKSCSNQTAMGAFDPTTIIQQALNDSGLDITLQDLNWPEDIQTGINALKIIQKTAFVLYCIAIGLIFLSLIAALPALFAQGRLAACLNVMVAALAFLAIGLASALVTAVIVKGSNVINKYGDEIGVEAHKGGKFLAITWSATVLMFIVMGMWMFETCIGHRRRERRSTYVPKHG